MPQGAWDGVRVVHAVVRVSPSLPPRKQAVRERRDERDRTRPAEAAGGEARHQTREPRRVRCSAELVTPVDTEPSQLISDAPLELQIEVRARLRGWQQE